MTTAQARTRSESSPARATRPRDRREQLLAAAAELFASTGYAGVALDDVGAAVGISGQAVYRHFPNKQALLLALVQGSVERGWERTQSLLSNDDLSPQQRVAGLMELVVNDALDNRAVSIVYLSEARGMGRDQRRPVEDLIKRSVHAWIPVLQQINPGLTHEQAELVQHAVNGLGSSTLLFPAPLSRTRMARLLGDQAVAATALVDAAALAKPAGPLEELHLGARDPRAVARLDRREQVLEVAVRLFRWEGFDQVAIDRIGSECGVSGPGVYRHFSSKEEMLVAAATRAGEQLAAIQREATLVGPGAGSLDRLVELCAIWTVSWPELSYVFTTETARLTGTAAAAVQRSKKSFLETWYRLAAASLAPDLKAAEVRARVHGALGLFHGHVSWPSHVNADQAAAVLACMVKGALLGA